MEDRGGEGVENRGRGKGWRIGVEDRGRGKGWRIG